MATTATTLMLVCRKRLGAPAGCGLPSFDGGTSYSAVVQMPQVRILGFADPTGQLQVLDIITVDTGTPYYRTRRSVPIAPSANLEVVETYMYKRSLVIVEMSWR